MVLVEKGQGLEFGLGRGLERASDLLLECRLIALGGQEASRRQPVQRLGFTSLLRFHFEIVTIQPTP